MDRKLYRDETHKVVGGVCAGLAEYFGIDVAIVRLIFLVTLILKGGGGLLYIILWIVLPKKPYLFQQPPVTDYTVPPVAPPQADPAFYPYPKKRSAGGVIAGAILVLLGMFFILDDLHIIPNWDMEHLWPVILIAIGLVVLFSGKKQPWEQKSWHQDEPSAKKDQEPNDNSQNDNPTTL